MEQTWSPERYAHNASFVPELGAKVLELLAARPGERILDLGCGDGALTIKIASAGCDVIGIDSSPEQVEGARKLGIDARVLDGHDLDDEAQFDAVFSNATLHWLKRPDEIIKGVFRALRPGGRFVGEFGAHGNCATLCAALVAGLERRGIDGKARIPWYFPTPEDYSTRLVRGGFALSHLALFPRPTPLPGDITGWLETFGESFTSALAPADRAAYIAEVREALRPALADEKGRWTADYVRLRFAATKPL